MNRSAIFIVLLLFASATGSLCERDFSDESEKLEIESDQPETYITGMVYNVVDGDTFNVTDFGRVRLADVDSPEIETPEGKAAKLYTQLHLQGKTVYLDVDDLKGTDQYGRWICVVRLESPSGEVGENFNRMLVDDGFGVVTDYKDNEFDPLDWWPSFRRVVIGEVELNPAGDDNEPGGEWVKIFNRGDEAVDVGGWTLTTTLGDRVTLTISDGTVIEPGESRLVTRECRWLDNSDESIVLKTDTGLEVCITLPLSDDDNDGQVWFLTDEDVPKWRYGWP
jgi:endonuclease YncB( thermonuclease family)